MLRPNLAFQVTSASETGILPTQLAALSTQSGVLEDGTPVKIRFAQTISSESALLNDRVEFEVLDEIRISDVVVIPKGGIAWGTVTEAQPKRRMGRGGKLENRYGFCAIG